jgi:hypothetical protein
MRFLRSTLLALLLVAVTATVASAHTPVFLKPWAEAGVQERRTIKDPERSWALYGRLGPGQTADVIPVTAQAGQQLYLQVLVPLREELRDFRPRVALVGPGLTGEAPADLPVPLNAGEGALALPEPAAPSEFYEPFTQTKYWVYGQVKDKFPAAGTYRIVVWDPAGKGGRYTVALGEREQFGPADLLSFPATWLKVRGWYRR